MKDKHKTAIRLIAAFVLGIILGYFFCFVTMPKAVVTNNGSAESSGNADASVPSVSTDTKEATDDSAAEASVEAMPEPEPVKPVVNGMFSWHKFKEKYLPILETYNIDQVYQCYNSQIREGDYDAIRKSLELLSDYDVWLLTGDASWDADDMLEKVNAAKKIGGFAGVVFDVEPKSYDETYLSNVITVCEQSDIPIMFCLSYRADSDIVKEVISVVDGLLVMNYDIGDEYANIKDWIPVAEQYEVPLITVYELQPEDADIDLHSTHTYNGDMKAVRENFEQQFAGEENIGIAYHYIKYVKAE